MKLFKNSISKDDIFIIFAIFMMIVLFVSSSMSYKSQTLVPFLEAHLKNLGKFKSVSLISFTYAGEIIDVNHLGYYKFIEFFIRKGSHFLSYFFLGFCLYKGLIHRFKARILCGFISYLATVGYASLDEFHQMLTGGRTPLFEDVILDGMGGIFAIIVLWIMSIKKQGIS